MPISTKAIALLALVVTLSSSDKTRAAEAQWFTATNQNLAAISDDSSSAVRLLSALTTARAVMLAAAAVDSVLPVRAFAVKNEKALRELVPQYWESRGIRPAGASFTGPYAGFVAIRANVPVAQQFPLLLHEYVHLLTAAHVPAAPAWLDEGLSEFWSALLIEDRQLVIGRAPAQYLKLLRTRAWLPLDKVRLHQRGQLMADRDDALMFYAQSWAMVHYLLLGKDPSGHLGFSPREPEWTPQLEAAIRAHVSQERFREEVVPFIEAASLSAGVRPISEARSLAERANMSLFGQRPEAAMAMARRALSLDTREPLALEVMGTYYFLQNQPDRAREWLEQAQAADPMLYSSALYLSLLSASAADRERYLQAAVKAKPDLAVAWQRLWTLYVETGRAEQARQACGQLIRLFHPWLWIDQPTHCYEDLRQ